ncbi:hypothetical protein NEMIN01_2501, partial [Nematocida minor]|uniref:uncharacterized protein n=1 Tax=Nematocida minor TaxID=1912983 RepID=UPI0022212337
IEKCKNKKSENLLKAASGSIQMQGEPGSTAKAKKSLVVNSQVIDNGMLQAIQKKIELEIELWIFRRLFSSRRRGYKVHYNKIYTYKIPNESITREIKQKFYQNELKRDIHFFSTEVAPVVEENLLWYFIASRTTTINLKYRDLLGLKALLSDKEANEHREMVEKFKGYYPGVIDEMIAYVDKHKPMRTFQNGCLHLWSEKLGDIYTREHLKPKHYNPKEDAWADQVERKYHPLACAVRMILVLPEVYMDFCKIDAEFIKNTLISENTAKDKKLCEVLLKIQDLVYMHAREKMDGSLYRGLYSALESMFGKERMEKLTTVELYKGMHAVIANFYKKSDSFDKRNKHILQGKFIIKNQTHVKCEAVLDTSQKDAGKHALASKYSLEENRWGISPDVHAHYHIYYVDNTTHQPRMLCMPMHVDADGHKYYLHTIRDIIEYIKELYEIAGSSDSVHPFKVHKKNKKWSYVKKKEERNKRVEELGEYEVVFYRIEEDPKKTKFTFAEFVPFYSHAEGNIAMPLFLTPLMQSAVDLGPFIKEKEHTLIDSLEFEDRAPDVYTYDSRYKNIEYSDVYSYYSNLYMLPHEEKRKGMECYAMSCATEKID